MVGITACAISLNITARTSGGYALVLVIPAIKTKCLVLSEVTIGQRKTNGR